MCYRTTHQQIQNDLQLKFPFTFASFFLVQKKGLQFSSHIFQQHKNYRKMFLLILLHSTYYSIFLKVKQFQNVTEYSSVWYSPASGKKLNVLMFQNYSDFHTQQQLLTTHPSNKHTEAKCQISNIVRAFISKHPSLLCFFPLALPPLKKKSLFLFKINYLYY